MNTEHTGDPRFRGDDVIPEAREAAGGVIERATGRPKRRQAIYCDDCGREKMAEIRDGKLVIMDRRHGRQHVAIVDVSKDRIEERQDG